VSAPADRLFPPLENPAEFRTRLEGRIATILKASREDSDVRQKELAHSVGWTRNMIANLETGRRSVQLCDFMLIATALHIDPERLLRRILQW
jgi:transcriptional regulator with XRE-family HTH domain